MRELCTYIGADAQAQQGLDENPQVQAAVEQVAQAAGSRNRQDDHHAGPDSVEQGNAEDDHQGQLDEGRGTDAEGAGQKTGNEAREDAVYIEFLARQGCRPHGKMMSQPGVLVEADIENQAEAMSMSDVIVASSSDGMMLDTLAPAIEPIIPLPPMMAPGFTSTSCSR